MIFPSSSTLYERNLSRRGADMRVKRTMASYMERVFHSLGSGTGRTARVDTDIQWPLWVSQFSGQGGIRRCVLFIPGAITFEDKWLTHPGGHHWAPQKPHSRRKLQAVRMVWHAHKEQFQDEMDPTRRSPTGKSAMTTTCKSAEDFVAILIEQTNRIQVESAVTPWCYELTTQIHNIGIVVNEISKTLLVNPSWLRFVVESDDFEACVADEIVDWYLLQELTGMEYLPSCEPYGKFN